LLPFGVPGGFYGQGCTAIENISAAFNAAIPIPESSEFVLSCLNQNMLL
jgi:hypothetical protein